MTVADTRSDFDGWEFARCAQSIKGAARNGQHFRSLSFGI
jgi:hypothetical protein